MKILSLFDGMACGYIAMQNAGVEIESYDAYEIDKYAIQTATHNFPQIVEHGDVFNADFTQYAGVDFSAAHKARELAKRFLKEYNLTWCQVQLSYAIGLTEPMAIYVDSNKGFIDVDRSVYAECTPKRIIEDLNLKNIDYVELAKFGHFTS